MTDTQPVDFRRIRSIIGFMRETTTVIDPEEALEKSGITSIDYFSESQLTYFLVQAGVKNTQLNTLFHALNSLETNDIRMINSDKAVFQFFMTIAGGLYYAKAIRRLIKKDDVMAVKEILTPAGYNFIFQFSKDKACLEDYQLLLNFEENFKAIGYRVLQAYFGSIQPIITHYVINRLDLEVSAFDIKHLRISNEYALELAIKTKNFIIEQSE
jgi:hypothetical protein